MALTNAEKQRRWRDKRNKIYRAVFDTPDKLAATLVNELGVEHARKVARALDKRIRVIKQRPPPPPGILGNAYSRRPPSSQ
jgi:hypothetical protein